METGQDSAALFKSLVTSLLVCVPSFCFSVYIIETHISWSAPALVMAAILCVGVFNFGLTVALEYCRSKLGPLTLPAMLCVAAVVLLFVIAESFDRFVDKIDYGWLLPAVAVGLALSTLAIFKERVLALKLHLAFNSLALAVLWGLGATGKISLPF